jgi:ribose transport system permease protein
VTAIGQNSRAAELAGLNVNRTRFLTYVLSAFLAGLCGIVLSGFSGGAALNMGEGFLLASIAVVVIGGTSVAGGRANVPGIWGAALFMYLLETMLNTLGASAGIRLILTGLIIIAVIVAAGGEEQR